MFLYLLSDFFQVLTLRYPSYCPVILNTQNFSASFCIRHCYEGFCDSVDSLTYIRLVSCLRATVTTLALQKLTLFPPTQPLYIVHDDTPCVAPCDILGTAQAKMGFALWMTSIKPRSRE